MAMTLFCMVPMRADVLVMSNGDRLTGTVTGGDRHAVTMKTQLAGEVTIKLDAVSELMTENEMVLTTAANAQVRGAIIATATRVYVHSDTAATFVNRESVQSLRTTSAQAAYEKQLDRLHRATLPDFWSGQLDAGLTAAQGSTSSLTYSVGAQSVRATPATRTTLNFLTLFSRNKMARETTSSNVMRGGLRFDRKLSRRLFTFGFADFESAESQNLELRSVNGGGLGVQIFQLNKINWAAFTGSSFNRETYRDLPGHKTGEALLSEELTIRPFSRLSLEHRLAFFPRLSDWGEHRMNLDATASIRLNRLLSWQVTVSNRYLSDPLPGNTRNGFLLTTGVRYGFGRQEFSPFGMRLADLLKR